METVTEVSVGGLLRAAFLRGESVVASDFAKAHGLTRQGVADAIKAISKKVSLTSTTQQRSRSGVAIVWSCSDLEAMRAYQPRVQNQNPMIAHRRAPGPFTQLLDVWGIGHADLRLPGVRHYMDTGTKAA